MLMFFLLVFLLTLAFVRLRMPFGVWCAVTIGVFAVAALTGVASPWLSAFLILSLAPVAVLLFLAPKARKQWLSKPLFDFVKLAMPPISRTEQEAIDAGGVSWEGEVFAGDPDWEKLFAAPKPKLSAEEKAFINGPVEQVCAMTDDWRVTHELNDLPKEVWAFLKKHKFFGLNAAKEHGGLEFSAYAQSCIVQKLATRSGTLAVTVMVPNSLGPAELLQHYGDDAQKKHYLPRLVSGKEVPCFGLTNPWAGSDAGGMPDFGVACYGDYQGKRTLGFRVNWEKRYITLGPVATLLGLAFKARDPEHLLGDEEDLGITCALVPTDAKGVNIGARHLPLNAAFQNGPNQGKAVFIPMQWIIGGQARVGHGWRMLMESLAAGRGISLPAAAVGAAKLAARTSGAYARVREQFGLPIGKFEGVEETLARIGGIAYLTDAARVFITAAIARGEKPAVLSAIVKQQCTDLSRIAINDAMDLHGGKAICMGRANYLARTYQQIPIGITVEGANILTRSMIIFGQGAMRCHPYVLRELQATNAADANAGLAEFDDILCAHTEYVATNKMRSFVFGLSRGYLARGYGDGEVKRYTQIMSHLSAAFAYLADVTLFVLGGDLKRREMLSGRFADALGNLCLASSALKRFADNNFAADERPLFEWACQFALHRAQQALDGILRNYPRAWLGMLLRIPIFPSGRYLQPPADRLNKQVAAILQSDNKARARLTEHMYIPRDVNSEIIAQLEAAFALAAESRPLRRRLEKRGLEPGDEAFDDWVERLRAANEISSEEAKLLVRAHALTAKVIAVDDFAPEKSKRKTPAKKTARKKSAGKKA